MIFQIQFKIRKHDEPTIYFDSSCVQGVFTNMVGMPGPSVADPMNNHVFFSGSTVGKYLSRKHNTPPMALAGTYHLL